MYCISFFTDSLIQKRDCNCVLNGFCLVSIKSKSGWNWKLCWENDIVEFLVNTIIATTELLNEADNDKEKYDYELRIDEQWIQ